MQWRMAMSTSSMILSQVAKSSICIFTMLLLSSCCYYNSPQAMTPFPPRAAVVKYDLDPIRSRNETDRTFIVTHAFVENSVMNQIFIDTILEWKRENGVK